MRVRKTKKTGAGAAVIAQLDIFGAEVKHPPPRPKVSCPYCGRYVTVFAGGILATHNEDAASGAPKCDSSGRKLLR